MGRPTMTQPSYRERPSTGTRYRCSNRYPTDDVGRFDMTAKAVPGPWHVEHRAGAVPKWGVYAMPRGKRQNVASFIPNEPTAQLIAAAPRLLQVAGEALTLLRRHAPASEVHEE